MKANIWDKTYIDGNDFAQLSTAELSFVLGSLDVFDQSKCLDIGCGTGALTRDLYMRGFLPIGIDTSDEAIAIAKKSTHPKFGDLFRNMSIEDIKAETFDVIFVKYVYKFIEDRSDLLLAIKERINADGTLVIIDPLADSLPEQKKGIVLDESIVQSELSKDFNVNIKKFRKNVYYFAKRK